jgi:hypothetical protein
MTMQIIELVARRVAPKGLDCSAKVNRKKLPTFFFEEDLAALKHLDDLNRIPFSLKPILFYPGCGCDVLTPLLYVEKILQPCAVQLIFVDVNQNLELMETILDDVGVPFAKQGQTLHFYWDGRLVSLEFIQGNVFDMHLPEFTIYFERAFRIMKSAHQGYESRILETLALGGVLISDSGFKSAPLTRYPVHPDLSSYEELTIGKKKL